VTGRHPRFDMTLAGIPGGRLRTAAAVWSPTTQPLTMAVARILLAA